jgi:hypothetical protein
MRRVWIVFSIALIGFFLIGCDNDNPLSAEAGEDFSIQIGQTPDFDGCASTGNIDNYRWTIIEAPNKMAEDRGKVIREVDANCSFSLDAAMDVDEVGVWVVELEVTNSFGQRATDRVSVTVDE